MIQVSTGVIPCRPKLTIHETRSKLDSAYGHIKQIASRSRGKNFSSAELTSGRSGDSTCDSIGYPETVHFHVTTYGQLGVVPGSIDEVFVHTRSDCNGSTHVLDAGEFRVAIFPVE